MDGRLNKSRKTALLLMRPGRRSGGVRCPDIESLARGCRGGDRRRGHQGWSANMYTLASDMFPQAAVGSVVGFASMAGSVGAMFAAKAVGYILQ